MLRYYYQNVYVSNLEELALTNEELPLAIAELREYMNAANTGEWTGLSQTHGLTDEMSKPTRIYTPDGRLTGYPRKPGLYIINGKKIAI